MAAGSCIGDTVRIRLATHDDAAAIARAHVDSWRTTYAHILPHEFLVDLSYDEGEELWIRKLSDQDLQEFTYVAEHSRDGIVGFATGGPERCGMSDYPSELMAIYLLESAQRGGIGLQLVSAVARRLAESGYESMMVWVLADNPSRIFYEKLGGEPIAEKLIELAGIQLIERAYGWKNLRGLIV
jgi:GNAT superfamily N-acetyltransferase